MHEEHASLDSASQALRAVTERAATGLVGRQSLVELVVLAAVAGEHLLVIGPPGTAKSAAVRRVADLLGGRYFEYLLSRFTEPSELFGAVDLVKLREGRVEVMTDAMLPAADVAFLDEVFLGSTAILNNLLALLNERRFRHGHTDMTVPLRVCVAASNALPTESNLAAFADRFLLRVFVEPVADTELETLLEQGWGAESGGVRGESSLTMVDTLRAAVPRVDLVQARPGIANAVRALRNAGVPLSDRRVVKMQRLVAAATVLSGRQVASAQDLWPLLFAVPTQEGQLLAKDLLREALAQSDNSTLPAAAEEASAGPLARSRRLVAAVEAVLAGEEDWSPAEYRLRLEGLAREIDAAFGPEAMPEALVQARENLVAALGESEPITPQPITPRPTTPGTGLQ